MKNQNIFLTALIAIAALTSCKKSVETNETTFTAAVEYQVQASNASSVVNRQTSGTLVWMSAVANATQIKFEAKKDTAELAFKTNVAQQLNLLAPVAASLGSVTLPGGNYREVEFKITLNKTSATPALELQGLVAMPGGTFPVRFTANEEVILKAEQNNVTITTGVNANVTTIDLTSMTSGISQQMFSTAQLTNGVIVISSNSNTILYNIIISALRNSHHGSFHH